MGNLSFSMAFALLLITASFAPAASAAVLEVGDFDFNGPLGSEGAKIEKVGHNHFLVTLSHAPNQPNWANMAQFRIVRNAKGNALRMDVQFTSEKPLYLFDDYFYSYSTDGSRWKPVLWEQKRNGKFNTLVFPPFDRDTVEVGHQVPMSHRTALALIQGWSQSPYVKVEEIGRSLLGRRPLYRVRITDDSSPHPASKRWVHYIGNEHPGEHNAQWRIVGMVEWLLSDEGRDARQRSIFYITLMMSPDAPSKGWYRVNAQGVDMNRSYHVKGANAATQAHESYVRQKALEDLMASDTPVTTYWAMHTWTGIVEPIIRGAGPEFGARLGPWEKLRDIIEALDTNDLIKPLKLKPVAGEELLWSAAPHSQFGITAVLVEGASVHYQKEQNLEAGRVLIQGITQFYSGLRVE